MDIDAATLQPHDPRFEAGQIDPPMFQATVKPHRSLSARGMFIVIGLMMLGSLIVTSLMYMLGAWPVIGFNGADIMLAVFLLWLNVRAARAVETISLGTKSLDITRTDIHGHKTSFSLPPYWLNIVLEERHGTVPKLILGQPRFEYRNSPPARRRGKTRPGRCPQPGLEQMA